MRRAAVWVMRLELTLALHLGAVGDYWAARAARRLGKFSGTCSEVLK